jgi:L-alanine-DL-glutamate epimerase-like enolase superfamily enzyme
MAAIESIRCVLLSSPYANSAEPEIKVCFPNGPKRTVGMVEVTLDNGVTGVGEGYMAVFAPKVFESIVDLTKPYLIGKDGFDIAARVRDLCSVCDYWSLEGAARHVTSAYEIALVDAKAKSQGMPAYKLFGRSQAESIPVYGSGGCCDTKEQFMSELDLLDSLGIVQYKIRAKKTDIQRTAWILEEAGRRGISIGIDMCQNLADPPQAVDDVVLYIEQVRALSKQAILFLEEAVGPDCPEGFKELRSRVDIKICGGEIITTPKEMINRINDDIYEFVQPDASVIGGITAVMQIFEAAKTTTTGVVVHAWGGAVAIMSNYHAAFAAGGQLVEYPMLDFPLGQEMNGDQSQIEAGQLIRPTAPGIGITLTPDIEARYPFDESAVYSCVQNDWGRAPDSYWQ